MSDHKTQTQEDSDISQPHDNPEDAEFLIGERKLKSATQDAFGHEAHVDSLKKIVAEVSPPWHIALYGTWGAGKSSIVNLLYNRVRADQADEYQYSDVDVSESSDGLNITNTLCVSFDAWKHAEDSLRTELLLDLNKSLQEELDRRFGEDQEESTGDPPADDDSSDERLTLHGRDGGVLSSKKLINELYDVQETETTSTKSFRDTLKDMDNYLLGSIGIVVLFGLVIISFEVLGNPLSLDTGTLALVNGIAAVFVVLGAGNALLSSFIEEVRDTRKNIDRKLTNPQKEWSGAYENLFDAIINDASDQYKQRHPEDDAELERIVITIDDIDRCQSQTTVEILIALKSFLSNDMCVYIIPCDEDALYEHLEAADQGDYLTEAKNQQNFLAKFFETEIEIPTASEQRLNEYFEGRKNQYNRSFDYRSLEVLQQAALDTPRRVTRALNRLVVLEELAANRGVISLDVGTKRGTGDEDSKADDTPTSDLTDKSPIGFDPARAFLAVISVLQTDYPRFHAALERDPELLTEVYEQLAGGFASDDRQGLDPLFESMRIPEERRDSLVSFLNNTQDVAIRIDSPNPYLRLTGSPPNPVDQFKSRFDRGRTDAARELIEQLQVDIDESDSEDTSEAGETLDEVADYITQKLSEEAAKLDAFPTAVLTAKALDTDRRKRVGEATLTALREDRPQNLFSGMELSEFEPLMDALPQDRTRELLRLYVSSIIGDEGLRPDNFRSVLQGPGELLEDPQVQEAFAESIHSARRQELLSDSKFAAIISDVREQKPELYTPQLVRRK